MPNLLMALQAALKLRMRKPKVFENATREAGPGAGPRFYDSLRVYSFLQSLRAFQNHAQEAAMVLNIVLNIVLSCSCSVYLTAQKTQPLLVRFVEGDVQFLFTSSPRLSFCKRGESPLGEVLVDVGVLCSFFAKMKTTILWHLSRID